jgi:hypothetical protein
VAILRAISRAVEGGMHKSNAPIPVLQRIETKEIDGK